MSIGPTGPLWDRHWMLCKPNGQFLSQRTHPSMVGIETALDQDHLVVSNQKLGSLSVPLKSESQEKMEVTVLGKKAWAVKTGDIYDKWFSDFFGEPIHLVHCPEQEGRKTSGNHGPITSISFADGYPLLLTNQSTLDELNSKLEAPVTMNRFRPNIIIKNVPANEEDKWQKLKIGAVEFLSVKACTRCSIIDVNPETGSSSKEVSATLKKYRAPEGKILFGQNLTHLNQGVIQVRQTISV